MKSVLLFLFSFKISLTVIFFFLVGISNLILLIDICFSHQSELFLLSTVIPKSLHSIASSNVRVYASASPCDTTLINSQSGFFIHESISTSAQGPKASARGRGRPCAGQQGLCADEFHGGQRNSCDRIIWFFYFRAWLFPKI